MTVSEAISESMQLESFQLSALDIAGADLAQLHALSISVRWPHRSEDWQFMRDSGRGIAAVDDIGRIVGSAMWFPEEDRFATIGMVITSPRLQMHGAAQWLMQHALADLQGYRLGLNATRPAERLYRSLGFRDEATVYQHQGEVQDPPPPPELTTGEILRPVTPEDHAALTALDRQAFRAGRTVLMQRLFPLSTGVVLERNGTIVAFSLCRRFGRGHVVGPLVAADDRDAMIVMHPHLDAYQGRFLRIDTRQPKGTPFSDLVATSGIALFDTVTTMTLGCSWTTGQQAGAPLTYGLVAQTLG